VCLELTSPIRITSYKILTVQAGGAKTIWKSFSTKGCGIWKGAVVTLGGKALEPSDVTGWQYSVKKPDC